MPLFFDADIHLIFKISLKINAYQSSIMTLLRTLHDQIQRNAQYGLMKVFDDINFETVKFYTALTHLWAV